MPPLLPSSPPTSRTTSTQRLPNAARATTAASQARASTPNKQVQSNGNISGQSRAVPKVRGLEKENEGRNGSTRQSTSRQSVSRPSGRRTSGANNVTRDILKDREPKSRQVEGLKDFVSPPSVLKRSQSDETWLSHGCDRFMLLHACSRRHFVYRMFVTAWLTLNSN